MNAASFQKIFKGKTFIVGVGNVMKGDDGFGPALAGYLRESGMDNVVDAGTTPENYLGKIAKEKPDTIIIADAAHMGKVPGSFSILDKEDIVNTGLTTHDMSFNLILDYLEKSTPARIFMVACQPSCVSFGSTMTPDVKSTVEKVAGMMLRQKKKGKKNARKPSDHAFSEGHR